MIRLTIAHEQARRSILASINDAPIGTHVTVGPAPRSLDQNAAQWPILECFAKQLQWPVNGVLVTMEPEEWKDVLTAAFKQETVRVAMGLTGGMVMLGRRTSRFKKPEFSEYLDFLKYIAAERGVDLSEPSQRVAA